MNTSRLNEVKAPQHRRTLRSRLRLLQLFCDFFLALRISQSGFLGDARFRLDAHGLQLLGDLALLLRDGAHGLEFFRHCLGSPSLHLLLLRLDLRW